MSGKKTTYQISLKNLMQNGITCNNVDIKWEKPSCGEISCDYDSKDTITVSFDDSCAGECIYAVVECLDTNLCATCPSSERIKICPCQDNSDCEDCEDCLGNFCVSKCEDGKVCDNGMCTECNDDVPCPNNQICVSGDCQCPPDKPFKNDKGECVDCSQGSDCPPCTICTPNGCVPVDCPTGACNPETGDCVGCMNTGDCDKENECCVDNSCDCCTGFVRDLTSGECIPAPACTLDTDCGECEICVDGICQPIECPEGYICVKGDCLPICDCEQTTCSQSAACVNLDPSNCYCNECEGNCSENGDCGDGCYCSDGTCKPKPCKGSCENGADCGDGCGCQDGECVPCDSLDCSNGDCAEVLGCGCQGNTCSDIGGCGGECSSSNDCGEGCTCYQGECVPCGDFSCDTGDCSSQPGCACNGGNCEGDGLGCKDEFNLIKYDESCDLEADLKMEEECSCPKLTFTTDLVGLSTYDQGYNLDFKVWLRKGNGTSLAQSNILPDVKDFTNQDIAHNEAPTSGTVRVLVQPFYDEYEVIPNSSPTEYVKVASNVPGQIDVTSADFADKSNVDFNGIEVIGIGESEGEFLRVSKVKVIIQQSTNFAFPNGCTYDSIQTIDTFTITSKNENNLDNILSGDSSKETVFEGYKVISSDDERHPLFTWYRSEDGIYTDSDIYRKLYIPPTSVGQYNDVLYGPKDSDPGKYPLVPEEGGLRSGKYYYVTNDCSCDKEKNLGKLIFCNPTELFYDMSECNTKVTLKEPFAPCSVNQFLPKFDVNDYSSQVEYEFYLNGQLITTFTDTPFGMKQVGIGVEDMFGEYNLPNDEAITNITLKINHDDTNECTLSYEVEQNSDFDIEYTKDCSIPGDKYIVYVPKNGSNYIVDHIDAFNGAFVTEETNRFKVTITKGSATTLVVVLDNNCSKTIEIIEDCCEEFDITFKRNSANTSKELGIDLGISGGSGSYTITYTGPGFSDITFQDGDLGVPTVAPGGDITQVLSADITGINIENYEDGTYYVTVKDSIGCERKVDLVIDRANDPKIAFSGYGDICDSETTEVVIQGDAAAINGTVSYTDNGISKNITLDSSAKATINSIASTKEYNFLSVLVDGVTYPLSETVNIAKVSAPTASISTTNNTICQGDSTMLSVTGTPNAIVTVINYGEITLDASGYAAIAINPDVTTVYTLLDVTFSSCKVPAIGSITITVEPPVVITKVSDVCDTLLVSRTLSFDNITSATDQSGNPLIITGNSVTVDPTTVSQVSVTFVGAQCTKIETFPVVACECTVDSYSVDNVGEMCNGGTVFSTPMSITLGGALNDIEIRKTDNTLVYSNLNVAAGTLTINTLLVSINTGEQLLMKITNTAIPTCFVDAITILPSVIQLPQAALIFGSTCLSENIIINTNLGSGYTQVWTVTEFATGTDFTPGLNTDTSLTLNTSTSGLYEVQLDYSKDGCVGQAIATFDVQVCCQNLTLGVSYGAICDENRTATVSGGQVPYTFAWTGTGSLGTVINDTNQTVDLTSLQDDETITLGLEVTDSLGCSSTTVHSYEDCTCASPNNPLNVLPASVDGTFNSSSGVANTGNSSTRNGNILGSGWSITGSPDSWAYPMTAPSEYQGTNAQAGASDGTFIGLSAGLGGESIMTSVPTVVGETYYVELYQNNLQREITGATLPTPRDTCELTIIFDGQSKTLEPLEFDGFEERFWFKGFKSFVATSTTSIVEIKNTGGTATDILDQYMGVDNVRIVHQLATNDCIDLALGVQSISIPVQNPLAPSTPLFTSVFIDNSLGNNGMITVDVFANATNNFTGNLAWNGTQNAWALANIPLTLGVVNTLIFTATEGGDTVTLTRYIDLT